MLVTGLLTLLVLGALLIGKKMHVDDPPRHQTSSIDVQIDPVKTVRVTPFQPDDHYRKGPAVVAITEPVKKDPVDEPKAIRGPRPVRLNAKDQLRYVWIPPGEFGMGCPKKECQDENLRRRQVKITQGFWLGQTEVTVGAYKRYTQSTGRKMPEDIGAWFGWKDDQQPMGNVTWDEAAAFCAWGDGRLPAEAEWEYGARAGTTGETYGPIDKIAWYYTTSAVYARSHDGRSPPVGLKQPNAFALYDMLGGVNEWVADYYDETYYRNGPVEDPKGPPSGTHRVIRGGQWLDNDYMLKAWFRTRSERDYHNQDLGFRCAGTGAPPSGGRLPGRESMTHHAAGPRISLRTSTST